MNLKSFPGPQPHISVGGGGGVWWFGETGGRRASLGGNGGDGGLQTDFFRGPSMPVFRRPLP